MESLSPLAIKGFICISGPNHQMEMKSVVSFTMRLKYICLLDTTRGENLQGHSYIDKLCHGRVLRARYECRWPVSDKAEEQDKSRFPPVDTFFSNEAQQADMFDPGIPRKLCRQK